MNPQFLHKTLAASGAGLLCVLLQFAILSTAQGEEVPAVVTLASPDQKNRIEIHLDPTTKQITYRVARGERQIIAPSVIEVTLAEQGKIAQGSSVQNIQQTSVNETLEPLWGKSKQIADHYNQATLRLQSPTGVLWNLELRAYDDGVAFRYGFPKQSDLTEFEIESEATQFRFANNPQILHMVLNGFTTSHESVYRSLPLAELPAKTLFEQPLLATWPNSTAAAIAEARLRGFAGMNLRRSAEKDSPLQTQLSPLPHNPDVCVRGNAPHWSPWRVILLADHAGKLIESNLLVCLNEPPSGDYSWLEPGKMTWHWWNGTADEGLGFKSGMNFATHKHYIDFCARHGVRYHSIVADDRPWHVQSNLNFFPGPDTDILTPRPELELPRLLEYAKSKNVGLRLWVHWKALDEKLEEAFATYERWGIRGLMVDFLDRNDQQMVEFNERVLKAAAKHKLHIQFHGSYPPTGEHHTFPHLINREAVLNLEYLKWGDLCSPDHNLRVAYTRLLAGPIDYHLGGFRSTPKEKFKPSNIGPTVTGSRCHHLALYVVFENPFPMVCDTPSHYEGQPGFDFLKQVPTTWDETRFLSGEVGQHVVVARRKGDTWYVGGLTNWTARELTLPLDFLDKRPHRMTLYQDADLRGEKPDTLRRQEIDLAPGATQKIPAAPGGGFVAIIRHK